MLRQSVWHPFYFRGCSNKHRSYVIKTNYLTTIYQNANMGWCRTCSERCIVLLMDHLVFQAVNKNTNESTICTMKHSNNMSDVCTANVNNCEGNWIPRLQRLWIYNGNNLNENDVIANDFLLISSLFWCLRYAPWNGRFCCALFYVWICIISSCEFNPFCHWDNRMIDIWNPAQN